MVCSFRSLHSGDLFISEFVLQILFSRLGLRSSPHFLGVMLEIKYSRTSCLFNFLGVWHFDYFRSFFVQLSCSSRVSVLLPRGLSVEAVPS